MPRNEDLRVQARSSYGRPGEESCPRGKEKKTGNGGAPCGPDLLSKRTSGSGGSVDGLSLAGPPTLISALPIAIRSTGKFIYTSFLLLL